MEIGKGSPDAKGVNTKAAFIGLQVNDNQKQARFEAQERNKLAQEDWRLLCKLQGQFNTAEIVSMVTSWQEQHPGIVPECFRDDSDDDATKRQEYRWRHRKGVDLTYGKADTYGERTGNATGRFRVLIGSEPQHRVLSWFDIPELVKYADVPMALLDPIFMGEANEILRSIMPNLCIYSNEYGEKGAHSHALTAQGATDLGRFVRVIPDHQLCTIAGYISKRLLWTLDNAVGYLIVKQGIKSGQLPGKRLPTRLTALGCGVGTGITFADIIDVLGLPLIQKNPTRMSEVENPTRMSHSWWESEPDDLPEIVQLSTRMSYAFDDDDLMLLGMAS